MDFPTELAEFRAANPDIEAVEIYVCDLNGRFRGKIAPADALDKLAKGGIKMPSSTPCLDIFSEDVPETGVAVQTGDPDGRIEPVAGSLARVLWAPRPTAQVQVTIRMPDDRPSPFDPRNILARIAQGARERGLCPSVALEIEFYLIDPQLAQPPLHPLSGARLAGGQVYDLDLLRAFEPLMRDITAAARALGVPSEGMLAEFGNGQFEINLRHIPDPVRAADMMIALKRAVRGTARAHGMDATFMAKPFGDQVGSGLHMHLSLCDRNGKNIFDRDGAAKTPDMIAPAMGHAVAAMLEHMADSMLIFAPHLNSYRRMIPGSFVPIEATWAFDNRGAALRLPAVHGADARIEHRVAGADANPYLVSAAILAAALAGLDKPKAPPPPVSGEIGPDMGRALPTTWHAAETAFGTSEFVAEWMGAQFRHIFAAIKRQERLAMLARVTDAEYETYLRQV